MSRFFTCVHVALRRSLTALAVASAFIPATALAVSGPAEADPVPTTQLVETAPERGKASEPSGPRGDSAPPRPAPAPARTARSEVSTPTAAPADEPTGPAPPPADVVVAPEEAEEAEEAREPAVPFAAVAGQELVLPDAVRGVGFHESSDTRALPLEPIGTPTTNLNAARITLPASSATNEYFVLPTRGRANGATTAVDIAVDHGVPVTAAVTGTVEEADAYRLYGRTHDEMVVLIPDDRPDLRVRVLHIEGLAVAPGDRVEAGVTVIAATSRQLPFRSQVDRYAGDGPHVHIEVRPHDPEADPDEAPPEG